MSNGKCLGITYKTLAAMSAFILIVTTIAGIIIRLNTRLVTAEQTLEYHDKEIPKKAETDKVNLQFDNFSKQVESLNTTIDKLATSVSMLSENTAVLNNEIKNLKEKIR